MEVIEQEGVAFQVRVATMLERKAAQETASGTSNPFLPYDPDLFVASISPTHISLLNKFNVVEHHLLIVTREFEHQQSQLTQKDCEALLIALTEIDGLAFTMPGPPQEPANRTNIFRSSPWTTQTIFRHCLSTLCCALQRRTPASFRACPSCMPTHRWIAIGRIRRRTAVPRCSPATARWFEQSVSLLIPAPALIRRPLRTISWSPADGSCSCPVRRNASKAFRLMLLASPVRFWSRIYRNYRNCGDRDR